MPFQCHKKVSAKCNLKAHENILEWQSQNSAQIDMLACVNPTGEVGRNIVRDEFNECKDNPHGRPALHVPNCGKNGTGEMPTSGGTRKSLC